MPIGQQATKIGHVESEYDNEAYQRDIGRTALLTAEEEQAVARRARAGDPGARELLILSNLRLVVSLAAKFAGYGVEVDDLIQEGNVGLVLAADKFDPELGHRFSTYATYWILRYIRCGLSDKARTIRLPRHRVERLRNVPEDEFEPADCAARHSESVSSLDAVPREILNGIRWLRREAQEDPAITAERREDGERVRERLRRMAPRDAHILRERIGNGRTLRSVGAELRLSRERIRQICIRAKDRYLQAV